MVNILLNQKTHLVLTKAPDRNPTVLANNGDKISDVGSIEIRVLRKIPLDSSASSSKTAATVLPTFMTATNWWDYSRRVEVTDSQIVPGYQIWSVKYFRVSETC
jgi:hypothetical protein